MNKSKKIALITIELIAVIALVIVAVNFNKIFAFTTHTDNQQNTFTTGEVEIDLQEPLWDAGTDANNNDIPDFAENIAPNATITKYPQVQNKGTNDVYVYLKVTVPAKNVKTANDDGTLKNNGAAADTQLFTYELAENSKWNEIVSARTTNTNAQDEVISYTYVYYYNEAVAPNATTDKLFTQVKYANVIEGENDNSTEQIDIDAYAIQSDGLPANTTIPGAYLIYTNQNN